MLVRTLPIRVAPVPGEALDSWLETIAARCAVPLGDIVRAVGITGSTASLAWRVVRLNQRERQDISYATGIDPAAIAATTLAQYDGTALVIDHAKHRLNPSFPFGCRSWSRYCPVCLSESDGRWQLQWRLGWTFACTRHQCLLADRCPDCGRRQRKTPRRYGAVPDPGHCAGTAVSPCGADLTTTSVTRFPDHHSAVDAQRILFDIIEADRAAFGLYVAQPCSAREALTDIKALASRILAYGADNGMTAIDPLGLLSACDGDPPPALGWRYRRNTPSMFAPQVAAEAAVAITTALDVLQAGDVTSAAEKVRWLVAGRLRCGTGPALVPYARDSRLVSAVLLKVFAPPGGNSLTGPHMQLRYRTTLSVPTAPDNGQLRLRRTARCLPSVLWPNWSIRLRLRDTHYSYLRCTLSVAALLVGTTASVEEAVTMLGGVIDAEGAKNGIHQLQRSPKWEGICRAVTRLGDYLSGTPAPINYERRRRLDYTTLLTPERWVQICRQTGVLPGKSEGQKALVARAYLYQTISCRPADEILRGTPPAKREELLQRITNFPRRVTSHLAQLLAEESHNFLRANHVNEPTTWSPPLELVSDLDLPEPDPAQTSIDVLHDIAADLRLSIAEIGGRLNISAQAVRYLLNEHPTEPRNASAVERARAKTCPAMAAEVLKELYVQNGLNLNQIAARFGTTRYTVKRLLVCDGVPIRHRLPPPSGDWLYEEHVVKRRTFVDIATETGVQPRVVGVWKERHKLASHHGESAYRRAPISRRSAKRVLEPWVAADAPVSWLRNYVETLRYPTMQVAAAESGISPATLRYRMRALERIFDAPLLSPARHGLPLRPTELGAQVAGAIAVLINPSTTV